MALTINNRTYNSIESYEEYLDSLSPAVPFDFKTKPDPHQIEWFNMMLERDRVILGDSMGLGKTKEYLDVTEYRRINKGYKKILFICKAKHKDNMALEVRTHTNSTYSIVYEGGESGKEVLRDFFYNDDYYLIMGYEMVAIFNKELRSLARTMGFDGIILDEFTKIKNWGTSGRTRKDNLPHLTIQITNLIEYMNPELLILGSGTPMTKDPTDLYAPLRLIKAERRAYTYFKARYCKLDKWGNIRGVKNTNELNEKLSGVMIRRPKDLLKLPPKRTIYLPVRMTLDQERLYVAALLKIKEELKGTKVYGASELALLTRLRQITTNPRLVDADIEGIKEIVLKEYVEDIIDSDERAIIYSIYTQETRRLREIYSKYSPGYIDGTMSSKEALEEVNKLQRGDTQLLIGSLHAIKESYTITEANYGIFMDLSWTSTDNEQAEDRMHRRGQRGIVNIIIPYCIGTIDERVLRVLEKDSLAISEIVDGKNNIIKKEIIDYMLS